MYFNHNRELIEFEPQIKKIKDAGFNIIGVSQMYFEDCFIFNTTEEAEKAYRLFERDINEKWIGNIVGWWQSKESFEKSVYKYENYKDYIDDCKVLTYWL
jgi:hypothetical protein